MNAYKVSHSKDCKNCLKKNTMINYLQGTYKLPQLTLQGNLLTMEEHKFANYKVSILLCLGVYTLEALFLFFFTEKNVRSLALKVCIT